MLKNKLLATGALLFLTACSNSQSAQMGMRSSVIYAYPQNMSNMQLCETLYFGRPTTQTKAAIGAEFNRRRLSKSWCEKQYRMSYLERLARSITAPSEPQPEVTQPIQLN